MHHLTVEDLIQYFENPGSDAERSAVETHLKSCLACTNEKQEFQSLMTLLLADSTFEPPAEVLQWGITLFQPLAQQREGMGTRLRRIVAALIFDSYDQPMLAGVRRLGVTVPPRQLLFRAGDVDVDLKIEAMEPNDRISLAGQVLSSAPKFFNNTPVKLESHGIVRYQTTTNVVGEFAFDEVPKDTYHLSVDLPEGQITLFCVHRGNS